MELVWSSSSPDCFRLADECFSLQAQYVLGFPRTELFARIKFAHGWKLFVNLTDEDIIGSLALSLSLCMWLAPWSWHSWCWPLMDFAIRFWVGGNNPNMLAAAQESFCGCTWTQNPIHPSLVQQSLTIAPSCIGSFKHILILCEVCRSSLFYTSIPCLSHCS